MSFIEVPVTKNNSRSFYCFLLKNTEASSIKILKSTNFFLQNLKTISFYIIMIFKINLFNLPYFKTLNSLKTFLKHNT